MNTQVDTQLLENFRIPAFPGSYFISFEGIEGAGKSTQIARLKDHLEKQGYNVIILREPGGTPFGERLRKAILESNHPIHPLAEAHLFASARAQLLDQVALKELEVPGTIVIADRYLDSSLAYQGHARELGMNCILKLHQQFPLNLVPHLTFYLRIEGHTSADRQKMRNAPKDYFESKGEDFYQKLVEGYDIAQSLFAKRIKRIDANRDVEQISQEIFHIVDTLVSKNAAGHTDA